MCAEHNAHLLSGQLSLPARSIIHYDRAPCTQRGKAPPARRRAEEGEAAVGWKTEPAAFLARFHVAGLSDVEEG